MVIYLGFVLRAHLGFGWPAIGMALFAFLGMEALATTLRCAASHASACGVDAPCLNGSLGYVLPLVLMLATALATWHRHQTSRLFCAAAGVFALAVGLRMIDRDICPATTLFGGPRGTHALWHVLGASTLYLLLLAAIHRPDRR